ncbi:AraC family transcriptional regulator [Roseibium sp. MMSF_3412]|uniref:AraC family transcriptional regulator n=1 Tax=Roseibium sp. MMSF_3412 TaxID=3046712 RepID=UPI00273EC2C8|nr:AraC family transcriptional regulator [Roseibium sp. MMSF_3412]
MALWFLPDQAIEKNSNFSLFTSSDIEDCLDFLQKPDSSISISQLGEGQCSSKVQMLDFGGLLVMIEDHSHVMEIDGNIPAGSFLFAFGLGPQSSLFVDGTNLGDDTLRVSPPCADCFEVFRPGGATALFAIDQDVLLSHEALIPEVADWLATRGRRTEFIRSARLTTRLRQDMEVLIQCASALKRQAYLDALGDLAISGLANALSFEWLAPPTPDFLTSSRSFERFVSARETLKSQMQSSLHSDALASLSTKSSRRTLEIAFKSNVNMGPAAYARVIRLNSARQKLLDGDRLNDSIGDIAAEEGFWEWSRFSKYYHKLFGELPSQTRGTRFPKGGRPLPLRR